MDIAAISSYTSQASLFTKVGVAVTKLALDSAKDSSQSLVSMMEKSVTPNLGNNIDIRV